MHDSRGGRNGGWQSRCQLCGVFRHTTPSCYSHVSRSQANLTYLEGTPNIQSDSHLWIPDTRATNHATSDIAALSTFEEYTSGDTLRVGDCKGLHISRVGHASIITPSRVFKMSDILHVPSLSLSLLSVLKFATDNDVFFEFHLSFFVVKGINAKAILLRDSSSGGLYMLPAS